MVKVYFGPYKHSPADELQHDERRLHIGDFGLLKGVSHDFWTNNPLVLDQFNPSAIYLWVGERWVTLTQAANKLLPPQHADERLRNMNPGRLALACELVKHFHTLRESANNGPPQ